MNNWYIPLAQPQQEDIKINKSSENNHYPGINEFQSAFVDNHNRDELNSYRPSSHQPYIPSSSPVRFSDISNSQEYTVLFIGKSGVGKSTLISGLQHYSDRQSFEEVKNNKVQICIPVELKIRNDAENGTEEIAVRVGKPNNNEKFNDDGETVTQKPEAYYFTFRQHIIKVIDTPGFCDSRGIEQDRKHLKLIKNCIYEQNEIHAICVVLKSNSSELPEEFDEIIQNLFSIFPKSALSNVFFFFTDANTISFGVDNNLTALREIQHRINCSRNNTYQLNEGNMCFVDSEPLKYLLSRQNNIAYGNHREKEFEFSWNETTKQIQKFMNSLNTLDPIDVEEMTAKFELEQLANMNGDL